MTCCERSFRRPQGVRPLLLHPQLLLLPPRVNPRRMEQIRLWSAWKGFCRDFRDSKCRLPKMPMGVFGTR